MIQPKGRKRVPTDDISDMYFISNGKLSYFSIFIIDLVLEVTLSILI